MTRTGARPAFWTALVVILSLDIAACGKPPARMAYDSIDGATVAVQSALRAFNVLYQNGQATEEDRAKAKVVYETYQKVAIGATYAAEIATSKEEGLAALKQASEAAAKAVAELAALTDNARARAPAPGGVK